MRRGLVPFFQPYVCPIFTELLVLNPHVPTAMRRAIDSERVIGRPQVSAGDNIYPRIPLT